MKIATIGTGFIVDTFLDALEKIDGVQCVAMYSRQEQSARPLADKYKIDRVYTDLDQMYSDPLIDFIYVASPNSLHYEHSYKALQSGKHVICEKPFTSTKQEAEQLISLAKQKNSMIFEAITTIHLPNYKLIKQHVPSLGPIRFIQCNYSQYSSRYDSLLRGETPNVFNPEYSGGALADINIYNLHFVMNTFGTPNSVSYTANKHINGIDTSGVLVMKYPEFIAECVGCKDTNSMNFVLIQGEKGYMHIENGANGCKKIILHNDQGETSINNQTISNLLYYELVAISNIFNEKDYETCYQLLDYTRDVIDIVEKARKDAGIVFAADHA